MLSHFNIPSKNSCGPKFNIPFKKQIRRPMLNKSATRLKKNQNVENETLRTKTKQNKTTCKL